MMKGIIIFFLVLGIIGFLFLFHKRRNLPFQEIVTFDRSVAFVNARKWYIDNIDISISPVDNHETMKSNYNIDGVYVQGNLVNNKKYSVSLCRTDLKGRLLYKKKTAVVTPKKVADKYIVLVGASIGSGWQFDLLQQRVNIPPDVILGFRAYYHFDKTKILDNLVSLPLPVHSIIIKECSAYFPRDIDKSKSKVRQWVAQLQSNNIIPILATVVPVTEQRDKESPGKQQSLIVYNDFVRSFTRDRGLPLLDLEKYLRISAENRHLKNEYAQKDGAHLLGPAYIVLDNMMKEQLISLTATGEKE